MELIIDFYKNLDTLNLIIFWGIIVVIILLLIFSLIMINKNKKLKRIVEISNQEEREIPIKENVLNEAKTEKNTEENIIPINNELIKNEEPLTNDNNIIEENNGQNQDNKQNDELIQNPVKNENIEAKTTYKNQPIEMPTGPYQRNVLREMSLSQTSPIGINRRIEKEEKNIEIAKDLEESLNSEKIEEHSLKEDINIKANQNITLESINQIKSNIQKDYSTTYDKTSDFAINKEQNQSIYLQNDKSNESPENIKNQELLNNISKITEVKATKSSSEIYLEEVSRKLAEAEIPDEIERTDYELEQEENAIISYKELMEKKDSIQTIDEEDAIISIEELINRSNKKEEPKMHDDSKLYNLTETEKNDDFIKELKQFRNDL